jgi:hypothetical protein
MIVFITVAHHFAWPAPQDLQEVSPGIRIRPEYLHGFSGFNLPEPLCDFQQGEGNDHASQIKNMFRYRFR